MLHPLIYLSALSLLAGAEAQQVFNISSELDISSCPIPLYEQMYKQIYGTLTLANFGTQAALQLRISSMGSVVYDVQIKGDLVNKLNVTNTHEHQQEYSTIDLDDTTLTLNSSTQLVHGVELSKDQTGVAAKVSLPSCLGYTISVFFDGHTAEMTFNGGWGVPVLFNGLCSNSSEWREARLSDYSANSCEVQYNDTADSTINCTWATQQLFLW